MDPIDKIVEITSGTHQPIDSKIILSCDTGEEEMLEKVNEMVVAMFKASGSMHMLGRLILVTSDGCFTIKHANVPDEDIELIPIDAKIAEPFIAANDKAKQRTILNVLTEKPKFSGRRSKGDRVRDRQAWRSKWR